MLQGVNLLSERCNSHGNWQTIFSCEILRSRTPFCILKRSLGLTTFYVSKQKTKGNRAVTLKMCTLLGLSEGKFLGM